MTRQAPAVVCIVVLGGGLSEDGLSLDARTPERVEQAVEVFDRISQDVDSPAKGLLVCSGAWSVARTDPPPYTEARLMADLALRLGVPRDAIVCEERSLDTIGNLAVVGSDILTKIVVDHVIVVSSDFHMRRVRYLVGRVWGVQWDVSYFGSASRISLRDRILVILREFRLMFLMRRLLRGIPPGDTKGCLQARPLRDRPQVN